jgi:hypothetical protein
MVREVAAALLLGLVVASGCAGKIDDGDDAGSAGSAGKTSKPKPSPMAQCQTYANTWCNKAFGCYVQVGRLDKPSLQANVDACIGVIVGRLPCSAVTSVSSSYNTCISQVKSMPCSKWDVPQTQFPTVAAPASCTDALSFE